MSLDGNKDSNSHEPGIICSHLFQHNAKELEDASVTASGDHLNLLPKLCRCLVVHSCDDTSLQGHLPDAILHGQVDLRIHPTGPSSLWTDPCRLRQAQETCGPDLPKAALAKQSQFLQAARLNQPGLHKMLDVGRARPPAICHVVRNQLRLILCNARSQSSSD